MFIIYAAPCEWKTLSEHIRTSNFDWLRKSVIYTAIWMLNENNNVHIIVISVVITVKLCKCIVLLYSPLNSYFDVYWSLNTCYYFY